MFVCGALSADVRYGHDTFTVTVLAYTPTGHASRIAFLTRLTMSTSSHKNNSIKTLNVNDHVVKQYGDLGVYSGPCFGQKPSDVKVPRIRSVAFGICNLI